MFILEPEFNLIRQLRTVYGDIYQGIWLSHTTIGETFGYTYNEYTHRRLVEIYGRLYKFNMDPYAGYIYNGVMYNSSRFMIDMCILIVDYYHKIPKEMFVIIFHIISARNTWDTICECESDHGIDCLYIRLAKFILQKGLNVNSMVYTRSGNRIFNTPLITFALTGLDPAMIDVILDHNPDLSIKDSSGNSAVTIFTDEYKRNLLDWRVCGDETYVQKVIDKFEALRNAQHV